MRHLMEVYILALEGTRLNIGLNCLPVISFFKVTVVLVYYAGLDLWFKGLVQGFMACSLGNQGYRCFLVPKVLYHLHIPSSPFLFWGFEFSKLFSHKLVVVLLLIETS